MNTRIGRAKFIYFRILLDSRSISTIVMGKLTSKIKEKININNNVGKPSRKFYDLKEGENRFLSDII